MKKKERNQKSELLKNVKKSKISGTQKVSTFKGVQSKNKKGKKEKFPRLVIRFNIKKVLPKDIRLGSKVPNALDKVISGKLKEAAERAKQNGRTTILPQDL